MMCEACERGDHDNCGMQTWCECDCEGYLEPLSTAKHRDEATELAYELERENDDRLAANSGAMCTGCFRDLKSCICDRILEAGL